MDFSRAYIGYEIKTLLTSKIMDWLIDSLYHVKLKNCHDEQNGGYYFLRKNIIQAIKNVQVVIGYIVYSSYSNNDHKRTINKTKYMQNTLSLLSFMICLYLAQQ